jgi:uncharacterized protein
MDLISYIAKALNVGAKQVERTLELLDEGATIPFISRYRKERTGGLDEVQLQDLRDLNVKLVELEKRKSNILDTIHEQGKLDRDLKSKIEECMDPTELEDIYLPYKPKRLTRAEKARNRGLEPLAKMMIVQKYPDIEAQAKRFCQHEEVANSDDALAGARDILAEWMNENINLRKSLRTLFTHKATLKSKVVKSKIEDAEVYKAYHDWEEISHQAPSHRILAMLRGESEGMLRLHVRPDSDRSLSIMERFFLKRGANGSDQVELAMKDSYSRLLMPSLETELRNELKSKADKKAIEIFRSNLRQLLLTPPLGQKRVLAIDPGFRTGCKVVCLDAHGQLIHNETIYPHAPQHEMKVAMKKIRSLVSQHKIEAIAIGNGTAGRETEHMIRRIQFDREVKAMMVSESGASIYSASKVAREEFPEYDVTVRGAVSIGRRLMDPLAEYVKIEPKALGVGQYQHDVDQTQLGKGLEDTVISCVNHVGVELNTASKELLSYVSGIGPVIAQNIVDYRSQNGAFQKRSDLLKVPRLGKHAYQQSAGFFRIRNAENPLDNTAVHPEAYDLVKYMAKKQGISVNDLVGNNSLLSTLKAKDFVNAQIGELTFKDIIEELKKPGRDPRQDFKVFEFDQNIRSIDDLKVGMVVPCIVTNITAFGAFVDLGIKENGLIHKSEMANEFVSDPSEYVKLNDKLEAKIVSLDIDRKRVGMSLKQLS